MTDTQRALLVASWLPSGSANDQVEAAALIRSLVDEVEGLRLRLLSASTGTANAERAEKLYREAEELLVSGVRPASEITLQQAHDMGAKGAEPTEEERLLFEEWMRGHCWAVSGTWNGRTYVGESESSGFCDQLAMHTRRIWAAWRDRAALSAIKGVAT